MGSYYIPPVNFGMVEDNLYRSGQPGELNFPFLEKLKLKKILYLSNEDPPRAFLNFVSEQGIEFEPLGKCRAQPHILFFYFFRECS
jgi:tyrosine-protein phosphatase OCA1